MSVKDTIVNKINNTTLSNRRTLDGLHAKYGKAVLDKGVNSLVAKGIKENIILFTGRLQGIEVITNILKELEKDE